LYALQFEWEREFFTGCGQRRRYKLIGGGMPPNIPPCIVKFNEANGCGFRLL
jgi:hypothetical protein